MIIGISGKINSGKDLTGKIIQILTSFPKMSVERVLEHINKDLANNKFEIKKFADKLKDIVCILIGCTREQLEDRDFKEKELGEEWWYWKLKVPNYNLDRNEKITVKMMFNTETEAWEYNDKILSYNREVCETVLIKLTPRLLLQLIGTECMRNTIHPNTWVNALMSGYKKYKYAEAADGIVTNKPLHKFPNWIITDMRFPNEFKAVKDRGGITIRVERNRTNLDRIPYRKLLADLEEYTTGNRTVEEHPSETALDTTEFDYIINNNDSIEALIDRVRTILVMEKII